MTTRRFVIAAVLVALFGSSVASAQATRVWVTQLGDDANPCSRTAPCRTFAGAITKVADGGEIDAIDAGGYGSVTITKSVTIDGVGTLAGILNAGVPGVVVDAPGSAIVTLRNLSIMGYAATGTSGVRVTSAGRVILENVAIANQGVGVDIAAPVVVSLSNCSLNNLSPRVDREREQRRRQRRRAGDVLRLADHRQ